MKKEKDVLRVVLRRITAYEDSRVDGVLGNVDKWLCR